MRFECLVKQKRLLLPWALPMTPCRHTIRYNYCAVDDISDITLSRFNVGDERRLLPPHVPGNFVRGEEAAWSVEFARTSILEQVLRTERRT